MSKDKSLLAALVLGILLASSMAAQVGGQQERPLPPANTVVEPRAYVSLKPVPRGHAFELAVVASIRPGFHINAHEVSLDYLIPTTLEAQPPGGIRVLATEYPPGVLRKFNFSSTPLQVYEERATLRMKLAATAKAPLGRQEIPLVLRYQACNQQLCLPPVKIPVTVELEIAPAGTPARPANSAIFSAPLLDKKPTPR